MTQYSMHTSLLCNSFVDNIQYSICTLVQRGEPLQRGGCAGAPRGDGRRPRTPAPRMVHWYEYPSIYRYIHIYIFFYLSIYLYQSIYFSFYISTSVHVSMCLSIYLCLFIYINKYFDYKILSKTCAPKSDRRSANLLLYRIDKQSSL